MGLLGGVLRAVGLLVAASFMLVGFALFFVVWLVLTITLIGPFLQFVYDRRDQKLLDRARLTDKVRDLQFIYVPHGNGGQGYKLAVRFTPSEDSSKPPVCIPNGLGATMMTISRIHEELVQRGYAVLSYDRFGVGLSDKNARGVAPTADEVVQDMAYIMDKVLPSETKWVLLGPSMGSIVAQYFIAHHPSRVVGFVNMDGFPYPFCERRTKFVMASYIYKAYAAVIWTGVMRPFISIGINAWRNRLESKAFSIDMVCAEVNQVNFFRNLSYEMLTMIDLADKVNTAWGRQSCLTFDAKDLHAIAHAKPNLVATEEDGQWSAIDDSDINEVLPSYGSVDADSPKAAVNRVKDLEPSSRLLQTWKYLSVAVMSGRNYNFSGASMFFDAQMIDWYAAEHALHALLAANGSRTVFPHKTHMDMFAMVPCIADHVDQVIANLSYK